MSAFKQRNTCSVDNLVAGLKITALDSFLFRILQRCIGISHLFKQLSLYSPYQV